MYRMRAVALAVLACLPACNREPQPLSEWQLDRLVAYAKLVGYLRHWHPSDQAATADWEQLTVDGIGAVEDAETPEELAEALDEVFRPVAPLMALSTSSQDIPTVGSLEAAPSASGITAWRHTGFGQHPNAGIYGSRRLRKLIPEQGLPENFAEHRKPARFQLGSTVTAWIPLTVVADTETRATWPPGKGGYPVAKGRFDPAREYGGDRETWLAAVILGWNVMQHFYPYFNVVEVDWDAALREALDEMHLARNERQALGVLRRMVAQLHDGHGYAGFLQPMPEFVLPVLLDYLQGEVVVTWVHGLGKRYFQTGDVLMSIDGRAASDWLKAAESEASGATPHHRRRQALKRFAAMPADSMRRVILERRGDLVDLDADKTLTPAALQRREFAYDVVEEVDPNYWYVNLDEFSEEHYREHLDTLAQARGIIFDMRGYPKPVATKLLGHLSDSVMQVPVWKVPVFWRPDQELVEWKERPRLQIVPQQPRFTRRVAFLTDSRAVSYAETVMAVVEEYELGAIVGEATAGTNGNINAFYLPGGIRMAFTGMVVEKHDGSRHHGVGIQPTLPATPTIAGIREGRDEVLEAALSFLLREA